MILHRQTLLDAPATRRVAAEIGRLANAVREALCTAVSRAPAAALALPGGLGRLGRLRVGAMLASMLRLPSIWLLCFGLVLTRLLGLHVHACSGIEGTPHQHEPTHYADSGYLFGESHVQDHGDNLELELAAAVPSAQIPFSDVTDDSALPSSDHLPIPAASGWMTVRTPRGPPADHASRPSGFAPPLRGPPSYSLA